MMEGLAINPEEEITLTLVFKTLLDKDHYGGKTYAR